MTPNTKEYESIPWQEAKNGIILASRSSGLGDRINIILNGLYLSQKLGMGFGFSWANSHDCKKHEKMPPVDSFFTKRFISKYYVENPEDDFLCPELPWGKPNEKKLHDQRIQNNYHGWKAPGKLNHRISDDLSPDTNYDFSILFKQIKFHKRVTDIICRARDTCPPEACTALHLRAGDVIFGNSRKEANNSNKAIPQPVAEAIIEKLKKQKCEIIVFGEDDKLLIQLKEKFGVRLAKDDMPSNFTSNLDASLYEMTVMSNCASIISGNSNFAKAASCMGGSHLKDPSSFLSNQEITERTIEAFTSNLDSYHPLQTSYACWYAYIRGLNQQPFHIKDYLLELAFIKDPDNQLYVVARACEFFKNKNFWKGDKLLQRLFESEYMQVQNSELPSLRLCASMWHFDILRRMYVAPLERAAKRKKPYAMILLSIFKESAENELRNAASLIRPKSMFLREAANTKSSS